MKKLLWIVLTLLLLLPLALVVVLSTLDLNAYKEEIQAKASEALGRPLQLAGDVSLSVYPWIGLEVNDVSLANAPGFGEQPMAKIAHLGASVKLLPLIQRKVEIASIRLQGAVFDLQKNAKGESNWDSLVSQSAEPDATQASSDGTEATEVSDEPALAALAIERILIEKANVRWRDATSGTDMALTQFDLDMGPVQFDQPFDLKSRFVASLNSQKLQLEGELSTKLQLSQSLQQMALQNLSLSLNASGEAIPAGKQTLQIESDLALDLAADTATVSKLQLTHAGAKLDAELSVAALQSQPQFLGQWSLNIEALKRYLSDLEISLPQSSDATVLSSLALSSQLKGDTSALKVSQFKAVLDQSTFTGNVGVALGGALPAVDFVLALDAMDVDRYLPEAAEPTSGAETNGSTSTPPSQPVSDEIELPVELLRQLRLKGQLQAGSLKVKNFTISNVDVPISASKGVIRVGKGSADLYQGKLAFNLSLDAQKATPRYGMSLDLSGIQSEGLVKDAIDKDVLSGLGDLHFQLGSQGNTVAALTSSLGGDMRFAFRDGAIKGINLAHEVRKLKALLKGQKLAEEGGQKSTDFSSFTSSAKIHQGQVAVEKMALMTPFMRINGSGAVDLPKEYLDMKFKVLLTEKSEGQGGAELGDLKGLKASVPIRGAFADLQQNFAKALWVAVKENAENRLKERAKAKLDAEKARAKARLKAEEDRLKAELEEKAKAEEARLKQRIEREKERLNEKLNEKLEDGLKKLFGG